MNDRVADYRDLVESLARKFVGRKGAEFDDLVQEGLINVWQTLERGVTPSIDIIEKRMLSWIKFIDPEKSSAVPYDTLLPLDDFQHLSDDPVPSWDVLA